MRKIFVFFLAFVLLFSGSSVANAASYKTKILIEGGWYGLGATSQEAKTSCYSGQYSRLDDGTRVTVKSGSGRILATGKLKWRVLEVIDKHLTDPEYYAEDDIIRFEASCQLYASITLPKSSFYAFKFGSVDGGTYSFAEMKSDKWFLGLTFQ